MNLKLILFGLIFFSFLQSSENVDQPKKVMTFKDIIKIYTSLMPQIRTYLKNHELTKDNLLISAILNNDIEQVKTNIKNYYLNKPFISKVEIGWIEMYMGSTYLSLAILNATFSGLKKPSKAQIEIIKLLLQHKADPNYVIIHQFWCDEELDYDITFSIIKNAFELDAHYEITDLLIEYGGTIPENTFH